MKKRIVVTKHDILFGRSCDPESCPVARALIRAGFEKPNVGIRSFTAYGEGRMRFVKLPFSAIDFITRFDMGDTMKPMHFEVEI